MNHVETVGQTPLAEVIRLLFDPPPGEEEVVIAYIDKVPLRGWSAFDGSTGELIDIDSMSDEDLIDLYLSLVEIPGEPLDLDREYGLDWHREADMAVETETGHDKTDAQEEEEARWPE